MTAPVSPDQRREKTTQRRASGAARPTASASVPAGTARQGTATWPTSPAAGATLKAEAVSLIAQRNWRQAERVARSARNLRPDDIEVDGLLAIATANRPWNRTAKAEITRLNERIANGRDLSRREKAAGLTAMSAALLARNDLRGADTAARQATTLAPEEPGPWWQLASSYAGLGWFDEADQCLTTATAKAGGRATPPVVRWQVGHAINRWAMTKTPALWIGVIGWLFMGLLGLAFAITTPFVAREFRTARLEGDLGLFADETWRAQHWTRVLGGLAVFAIVATWVIALTLVGSG